jgi:hypothetical protein
MSEGDVARRGGAALLAATVVGAWLLVFLHYRWTYEAKIGRAHV